MAGFHNPGRHSGFSEEKRPQQESDGSVAENQVPMASQHKFGQAALRGVEFAGGVAAATTIGHATEHTLAKGIKVAKAWLRK